MSKLRQAVGEYLAIRRALGFKLESQEPLLYDLAGYLERAGAARLTIELAVAWATQPSGQDPVWCSKRLSVARGFAKHLHDLDPLSEVPPADLLPEPKRRATPYLYSPAEIVGLMRAARTLSSPLKAATCETLVGLLAATGMRVGEAIRLNRDELDLDHELLTVVHKQIRQVSRDPAPPDYGRGAPELRPPA